MVSACSAEPGEPMVPAPYALPAAMTNSGPPSAEREFTAWDIGSVPSSGTGDPRLMETTSAPSALAHSMASMIPESAPEPSSLRTLPTSRSAAGATPLLAPSEAAPDPAMVEATCVP